MDSESLSTKFYNSVNAGIGFDSLMKKVKLVSLENGQCILELTIDPEHVNVLGHLHGGFAAYLVDVSSGLALISTKIISSGTTIHLNVSYIKAVKLGEVIQVITKVIRAGKNIGFFQTEIKNKITGDVLVEGSVTEMYQLKSKI